MISAKQKANRERFKKVMAEAKKIRAKNKSLTQAEAVKKAWAMYKPTKVGAYKKTAAKKVKRPLSSTIKKALLVAKKAAPKKAARKKTVGSTYYFGDGKVVTPGQLKIGEKYEWIVGAEYLEVEYIGLTKDFPALQRTFITLGDGRYLFQFVKDKSYVKIGAITVREYLRTIPKVSGVKKPIVSRHKDTKSHNVNIRVMSGFQEFNTTQVKELQHLTNSLASAQYNLKRTIEQKKATRDKDNKMYLTRAADRFRDEIAGLKKQITIVKRLIK